MEVTLKTENVQLMTEEELKRYRLARGQRYQDFPRCFLPGGSDVWPACFPPSRVTAVNVIDHYAPRASYTFRISTYRDGNVGQLHRDVTELLVELDADSGRSPSTSNAAASRPSIA